MAFTSTGFQAPATSREGLVPSVYDKIIQIGWAETPILRKIGTSNVTGIQHSWIIDPIGNPTRTPQLEISDFVGAAASTKQKRSNVVEIFTDDVLISKDMLRIKTYGGNEEAYEVAKKAKEHTKRFEQMILGIGRDVDAKVSVLMAPALRTDSTAGAAAGIFYYLAKGEAAFTDALMGNIQAFDDAEDWTGDPQDMTWEMFNSILQIVYNGGATPKDVFVGANLKAKINDFTTRYLRTENHSVQTINSIDTDFGTVNIHLTRWLGDQFGLGDVLIAGDFDYMKHGLLTPTTLDEVPTSKTAKARRYYTSSTLEVRNADAFAIGVGLK